MRGGLVGVCRPWQGRRVNKVSDGIWGNSCCLKRNAGDYT
uniref:Uncharacterized protein n=1 Tax=Neisseria meningitidis alpha522 TaxID=996307 RepID=I4E588_NEIME|nr:hypothetical protein NMALPHA522_0963 [Neisseria meningitidis alpha522]